MIRNRSCADVVSVYSTLTSIAKHKDKVASIDSAPAFTTLHSAAESADMQATPDSAIMITTHQLVAESGDADKVPTLVPADSTSTPLHSAARSGNFDEVKELLENEQYSVNCTDSSGQTPLHCACKKRHLDVVKALVAEFQADLTIQDSDGRTALMLAARSGDDEIGNVLIAQAVLCGQLSSLGLKCKTGRTALHYACQGGSVSLFQTLIREHKADVNVRDDKNDTPLNVAGFCGKAEVALSLINEFGCDPNVRGQFGRSVLHDACQGGSVSLVQTLIREHKADANDRDDDNNTPLNVAAFSGKSDIALSLINEFGCDPNVRGRFGRSVLHNACQGGSVSLVQTLIREHKADANARDDNNNTPLNVAAFSGKADVALSLINEFGCDPNVRGEFGRSVLHNACEGGSVSLVQTLIREHKADANARDDNNNTPLNVAAYSGKAHVALSLINEFGCDPNVRDEFGRSVLHNACQGGSVSLVQTLIREHKADVNAGDDQNNTPLNVAAFNGKADVALSLINEFGCDPNVRGQFGRSVIHQACDGGSVSLVQTLIREHKADVNARDDQNDTPLNVAALSGKADVALSLINEFGCDPNVRGKFGRSVIHQACQGGSVSLVQTLIREHKADANARDDQNDTPLNVAAFTGKADIALSLINEFGCDPNVRGKFGRSVLHDACYGGSVSLVQTLIREHKANANARDDTPDNKRGSTSALGTTSLLDIDDNGNTPLHLCAWNGHAACVEALLSANAPLLIRDNYGRSPMDVSKGKARVVLQQYLKENRHKLRIDYNAVLKAARKRYSGKHPITRLFVLGNPGAGKSSLVESFKTEGILRGFWGIRESSVLLHTAGIVPSIYISKRIGRVLLYDFAGDPEYYSSHAAILENLASSETGKNLIIVVVDLTDTEGNIINNLQYWVSFIQCQKFVGLSSSFIFVGSHLDSLRSNQIAKKREVLANFAEMCDGEHYMIDCRKPRSLHGLDRKISSLVSSSQRYNLSNEASLLLGLLEKDFGNVTACSLQTLLSHNRDCGVCLPTDAEGLYVTLSELHDIGILLLLGDHTKGDCHIVLQSAKLTNEVHELLFCKSSVETLQEKFRGLNDATFEIGLLPESVLKEILPPYITTKCLSCLQYCQEINCEEICAFISGAHTNQSFFFFPALCNKDRSGTVWVTPLKHCFSIGWLARCTDPHEFFPPRFLHVLLLRLVFRFTLSAHQTPSTSLEHSDLQRFCTMWKTGVYWLMREGVECLVELVNGSKGVLIITKSIADRQEICSDTFGGIISCVMEAKAEFCQTITPQYCLLDSTDEADFLNEDNLFAMREVEYTFAHPEVSNVIPSLTGKKVMERSRLLCLRKLALWDSFFPMEFVSVLRYLKPLVTEVYELGLELKVPVHCLETISSDFPTDTSRRRRELVRVWMSSSLDPPCWWHLVRALRSDLVGRKDLATNIKTDFSKFYRLMCIIFIVNLSL